jgi:hypothetical protein
LQWFTWEIVPQVKSSELKSDVMERRDSEFC